MCTTYLSNQLDTYLPTYEKKLSSNVIIHIDKKNHEISRKHVKCIWYHIIFTKWWGGLMAKSILVWNHKDQSLIPFTNIYYVEYAYSYLYLIHVYKCIEPRWVVGRQVGGHGGQVDIIYFNYYYIIFGYQIFGSISWLIKKPPIKLNVFKLTCPI